MGFLSQCTSGSCGGGCCCHFITLAEKCAISLQSLWIISVNKQRLSFTESVRLFAQIVCLIWLILSVTWGSSNTHLSLKFTLCHLGRENYSWKIPLHEFPWYRPFPGLLTLENAEAAKRQKNLLNKNLLAILNLHSRVVDKQWFLKIGQVNVRWSVMDSVERRDDRRQRYLSFLAVSDMTRRGRCANSLQSWTNWPRPANKFSWYNI